jgi:hypothetical protein
MALQHESEEGQQRLTVDHGGGVWLFFQPADRPLKIWHVGSGHHRLQHERDGLTDASKFTQNLSPQHGNAQPIAVRTFLERSQLKRFWCGGDVFVEQCKPFFLQRLLDHGRRKMIRTVHEVIFGQQSLRQRGLVRRRFWLLVRVIHDLVLRKWQSFDLNLCPSMFISNSLFRQS